MKILSLFILLISSSHALEKKSSGGAEYVITSKNLNTISIKSHLKIPPDEFRSLGNGQYYIKYKKDPGLPALKKQAGKSFEIQPNFVYKSLK